MFLFQIAKKLKKDFSRFFLVRSKEKKVTMQTLLAFFVSAKNFELYLSRHRELQRYDLLEISMPLKCYGDILIEKKNVFWTFQIYILKYIKSFAKPNWFLPHQKKREKPFLGPPKACISFLQFEGGKPIIKGKITSISHCRILDNCELKQWCSKIWWWWSNMTLHICIFCSSVDNVLKCLRLIIPKIICLLFYFRLQTAINNF